MLVRFRVNLGTLDIATIQKVTGSKLDVTKCKTGCELNTSDEVGEWLLKRGIVEAVERAVRGVARQSEVIAPAKDK